MVYLDIRQLSEAKVAAIDHNNLVSISARTGSPLPLSPYESRQFQIFLAAHESRQAAVCGGPPIAERVLVWKPADAKAAIVNTHLASFWPVLERRPGRALLCGELSNAPNGFYYGGFSPDATVFVFIPTQLHEMRYRELLIDLCRRELPGAQADDLHLLASVADTEELSDDPADGRPSPMVHTARELALDIGYWLQFAGPEPTAYDRRDARR